MEYVSLLMRICYFCIKFPDGELILTINTERKMKKLMVLGMGLCIALAFTSCKSSESAYKKAYEKAKQQELAEAPVAEEAPAAAPLP